MQNPILVYGVPIENKCLADILSVLRETLSAKRRIPFLVFTPNLEMLSRAKHSKKIQTLLSAGDLLLPDGIGVCILSRLRVRKRIAGIDVGEALLSLSEKHGYRVYLLGGKEGVAKAAAHRLTERFPTLSVVGTHHGYFGETEAAAVTAHIRTVAPDILFVCMGFPRQEQFLIRNRDALSPVRVALGLGGALDVWSENTRRAPLWMQKYGLEWFYRLLREPSRLPRLLRSIRDVLR